MKNYITTIPALFICLFSYGQKIDYNLTDGYIADGYDVVSYFDNAPKIGNDKYRCIYDGAKFKFSSESNLNKFKANPKKFVPQYGGWCCYAIGSKNRKVTTDPETYAIRKGKLYLFYHTLFNNTLNSWKKKGPAKEILKADNNWEKLKYKDN